VPDIQALLRTAAAHHQAGRLAEAVALYRQLLVWAPDHSDALHMLGNALLVSGRPDEALACHRRVVELRPDFAEAWNNIGLACAAQSRHVEAIENLRQALAVRPDYADALQNLGTQYQALDRFDEALASYRAAVALKPASPVAHNNMGNALLAIGDLEGSLAAYQKAIALDPGYADAYSNLGNLLQTLGRLDESVAAYDKALVLNPGATGVRWNKAFGLLLKGDYAAGWPLAEARWEMVDPSRTLAGLRTPPWLGVGDVRRRSILLHHEQGLGDTLQMLRYVPLLAARGARVIVRVPASLSAVAATVPGVAQVVVEDATLPPFDLHCPFMSLPLAFRTTLATVPSNVPYLSAPEPALTAWGKRLGPRARRRIGLAWSGAAAHRNDRHRSIGLQPLLALLHVDAEFVSLQKEYVPADEALLKADGRVRDFSADLADFAETAGLVEQLDLVISVDTSVAHLAGGMGKPVWLLLPFAPDYRWMLGRADSPWYPGMRLFRQPVFGDWAGVVREVAAALDR
jgi:tetratricopeptide (TPR) repeat protein